MRAKLDNGLSYLRWAFAIVVVLLAMTAPALVHADTPDRAALLAKQDALFQRMLTKGSSSTAGLLSAPNRHSACD